MKSFKMIDSLKSFLNEKEEERNKKEHLNFQDKIKILNKMFEKHWNSLFNEKCIYEKWNEKPMSIYINDNDGSLDSFFIVKNTTINKIELEPNGFIGKNASIKNIYNQILTNLICSNLKNYFNKIYAESKFKEIFGEIDSFQKILINMKSVLGDDSIQENVNELIVNNKVISCPNLEFIKYCYGINIAVSKENLVLNNKDLSLKLFNIIMFHNKIKDSLPRIINDLSNVYDKEIYKSYNKTHINKVKNTFETICKKYSININEYKIKPIIDSNNRLSWTIDYFTSFASKNINEYLNNYTIHKTLKNVTAEDFNNSLINMEQDIFKKIIMKLYYETINDLLNNIRTISDKVEYANPFDDTIFYENEKFQVQKTNDEFILTHNNYKFIYYLSNPNESKFLNCNNPEDFTDTKKFFQEFNKERDLFIKFLKS